MKITDFARRTVKYYRAGMSIHLEGAMGRGKTTTIEATPAHLSRDLRGRYGLVLLNGPTLNPPDTIGYLMPRTVGEHLESLFTDPFFWKTKEGHRLEEYDGGIVFIDEWEKMDTEVKKILGETRLSGRLGPHRLPPGWIVWSAGNRKKDRSGATKEYDYHINRTWLLTLEDDLQGSLDWFMRNGVHPALVAFAANNPQVLFMDAPEVQGPFCTPRALVEVSRYLTLDGEEELPTDPLTVEDVAGKIGPGAAAQLFSTLRLNKEMPKFEDIVAAPKKVKVPSAPDAQMLVCYSLAARVDEKTVRPVVEYIERFPAEFAITFGQATFNRDPDLVTSDAFGDWISKNASLMMAITSNK